MTAPIVYMLCALTSIACAGLLLRSYFRGRARLLFWSALCFVFIGISNILLFFDMIILPTWNLSPYRHLTSLIGVAMLLYGMIWETK
ncbi:MAG TPA: DUF5985 family protein [Verrucomicrobiae bacterium]|nr:DUF5985 family protein [Verrucomicrobiae bacterium]